MKKGLKIFSFFLISGILLSIGFISAKATDLNGDGKISFSEWIKGIFSKRSASESISGAITQADCTNYCTLNGERPGWFSTASAAKTKTTDGICSCKKESGETTRAKFIVLLDKSYVDPDGFSKPASIVTSHGKLFVKFNINNKNRLKVGFGGQREYSPSGYFDKIFASANSGLITETSPDMQVSLNQDSSGKSIYEFEFVDDKKSQ